MKPNYPVKRLPLLATSGLIVLMLSSCAIPSAPTGGPRDTQPPQLVDVSPQPGSVNVKTQTFEFTFNEYVDRGSFEQALSIEPRFDASFSTDWKRQRVTVRFEESLPEDRTMIFTIGTELRDTRGNKLKAPIQIPISTGPEIDEGELAVQVRDAITGVVRTDESVFLFLGNGLIGNGPLDNGPLGPNGEVDSSLVNDLGQIVPDYTIQTDSAGVATFQALGQQAFTPLWVNDLNRNRRWEPARERAQPFEQNRIAPSDGLQSVVWVYEPDTVAPRVQGVGVLALNQLRIRASEPLVLVNDSVDLSLLEEGVEGQILEQAAANQIIKWNATASLLAEDSTTVVVTVDSLQSLRSEGDYILLYINQITDRSRNSLIADSLAFNTNDVVDIVAPDSSQAIESDTVEFDELELVDGRETAELLVVLESYVAGDDSTIALLADSMTTPADSITDTPAGFTPAGFTPADSTLATSPQTYSIVATLELIEPFSSRVLVDTVLTQPIQSQDSTQPAESTQPTDAPEPLQLRFAGLPPTSPETSARLTVFIDLNGDGEWSFNTNPAEPRRVVSNIQLLNDFEGTIEVSFSLF